MFGTHDFALFVAAGLLLNITPGPDMLYIVVRSTTQGWRAGAAAALGIGGGCFVHIAAAALGLSAALAASAAAFAVVKIIGASYLLYVGLCLLLLPPSAGKGESAAARIPATTRAVFRQGFLTNVLNPKIALFFLAFVPQFIRVDAPHKAAAFLFLGIVFDFNGTLWNLAVAWFAAKTGARLQRRRIAAWLHRCIGACFIYIGARLAFARAVLPAMALMAVAQLSIAPMAIAQIATAQAPVTSPPSAGQRPAMIPSADTDFHYKLAPDAIAQDGVPTGEIKGPYTLPSEAYPGTLHTYWIYVPAQYDRGTPASLMIFNDGHAFLAPDGDIRAPVVMDNLIYRREIPVMIGVFINPGRRADQPEATQSEWGDRTTNRPAEYNTLDDKYARVIVDELLPVLYKEYNISRDPERHGIGGSSSGAIAAFTVAWERPGEFRKVLSNVGSFTNIRGGNAYPDIIRRSDRKPLRIFLADGRNDNRGQLVDGSYDQSRDWFYQNVRMQQALSDKGYEVNYVWGIQRHGQKMLQTVFPEMMRWLWRDHGVSTDVSDAVERSFNEPKKPQIK